MELFVAIFGSLEVVVCEVWSEDLGVVKCLTSSGRIPYIHSPGLLAGAEASIANNISNSGGVSVDRLWRG